MTEHRVNPLQWLSTKFASLNHSHNEYLTNHQDISGKEDISSKVTSLSENSTNTQYPSAKAVYDEYMNTKTVTPEIQSYYGNTYTLNGVTKSFYHTGIDSEDLGYYDRIIYTITFNDNTFQMCNQSVPSMGGGVVVDTIYFDGSDCYWGGEWDDANQEYAKGNLICEGNTLQAILQGGVITVNGVETNWEADGEIRIFGNGIFSYTVYSYKYISTDYLNVYSNDTFNSYELEEQSMNGETKMIWEHDFHNYRVPLNLSKVIYTITFNDNTFSYARPPFKTIYFDGTDCYEGEWDDDILVKGNLICEGNELQILYQDNYMYFPDGSSDYSNDILTYLYSFGEVVVKAQYIAPRFEYAQNKKQSLFSSYYDESIVYPSVSAVKNYAENKSNKTSSWNSTTDNTRYPTEKLVKDSLDSKEDKSNKVTSISSSSTDTQYPSAKLVYDQLNNKAPTSHASSSTTYGVATNSNYGHTKVINNLTTSVASNGQALNAYQGKVLNDNKIDKNDFNVNYVYSFVYNSSIEKYAYQGQSGAVGIGVSAIDENDNSLLNEDGVAIIDLVFQNTNINYGSIQLVLAEADGSRYTDSSDLSNTQTIATITDTNEHHITIVVSPDTHIEEQSYDYYDLKVSKISYDGSNITVSSGKTSMERVGVYLVFNGAIGGNIEYMNVIKRTPIVNQIIDIIYPIGSTYISVNSVNPSFLFGGQWEQIQDKFLLASGSTYSAGSTGGSATVALTKAQMPRHNHTQAQHRHKQTNKYSDGTGSAGAYTYSNNRKAVDHYTDYQTPVINHTGGTGTTNADANGSPHENMPPYLTVYMWKRIA